MHLEALLSSYVGTMRATGMNTEAHATCMHPVLALSLWRYMSIDKQVSEKCCPKAICTYIYIYTYTYIFICIYRKREKRERERAIVRESLRS